MSKYSLIFLALFFCSSACKFSDETRTEKQEAMSAFMDQDQIDSYPFDSRPFNVYERAYRVYLDFKSNHSYRSKAPWTSIGPNQIAGRTLCIAIDPRDTATIWVGTASGGLWKSTKGGIGPKAWQQVPTGFPCLSVNSIYIDPQDPNVIFIGTGEIYNNKGTDGGKDKRTLRGFWGIGLLKSIDNGKNWTKVHSFQQNEYEGIYQITKNQSSNTYYFASTAGLYSSQDNGNHWTLLFNKRMITHLYIHPLRPDEMISVCSGIGNSDYGLFKTKDSGKNWKKIILQDQNQYQGRIMFAAFPNNPDKNMILCSDTYAAIKAYRTDNFWDSQYTMAVPDITDFQGWYANSLLYKANDATKIIAGGVDVFSDTTGTGLKFSNLFLYRQGVHADCHDLISNPKDANKIYLATDGGLFRSDDFGKNFYSCNDGLVCSQFYQASVNPLFNLKYIGGLQDNSSAVCNQNLQWKRIHYGDGICSAIDPFDTTHVYIATQYMNLDHYKNQKWTSLIPANDANGFASQFFIQKQSPYFIFCGAKELLRGKLNDTSFLAIKTPSNNAIHSLIGHPLHSNSLYLSTYGSSLNAAKLFHYNTQTNTFNSISSGLPQRIVNDIAVDPTGNIIVCLAGFGSDHLFKSYDNGQTWNSISNGLPDIPFHSVYIDPRSNQVLYAGCEFGLYVSTDGGQSWKDYNRHQFDLVPVYDIHYDEYFKKIVVFSHGLGVFHVEPVELINSSTGQNHSRVYLPSVMSQKQLADLLQTNRDIQLFSLNGQPLCDHEIRNNQLYIIKSDIMIQKIWVY